MKKIIALMISCVLCATAFIGCSKKNQGSTDPVQVDVRIYKAGYGTDWFKAAKEKFEELYKDSGYTINIVEESSFVPQNVISEIKSKKNTIDLYITGDSNFSDIIKNSKSVLKTQDTLILENLNDVFASKAIKFDGTEENITIGEKLNESDKRFLQYPGTEDITMSYLNNFKGNYYAFPWASGVAGFILNKSVFDRFEIEIPRTTDELLAAYNIICPKVDGVPQPAIDGVYPMTYGGNNASGYWLFAYDTFFAQYSGVEAEKNFWSCTPAKGTMSENGYDVYKDEGILKALEVVEKLCDEDYCANGTINLSMIAAQLEVLQGNAAIMPTGNWVYSEMKLNYADQADNAIMIKMPVISALGTKLGITDAVLSAIIKGVDVGKNNDAIASEQGVKEDIVQSVREARNIYFDYSTNHIAYIPSYSTAKDVAKLFLRFLASDDNLDLYKTKAYASLPFKYAGESKTEVNDFVKSVDDIMGYGKNVLIAEDIGGSPMRQAGLHCFPAYGSYPDVFTGMSQKLKDNDGNLLYSAQKVFDSNYQSAYDEWEDRKKAAHIN